MRDAARNRVEATLSALREVGIEARGDVMDPDPFSATLDAVREYGIDEIIISTHPATRSGWLRRDLIERVQEATELPVEHVVVDLDADRAEVDAHARRRERDGRRRPAVRRAARAARRHRRTASP